MRPEDIVAAVAFDRDPHWLVGPSPVQDAEAELYTALRARLKHILLVSDGRTVREGRNFGVLYREVADSGVGLTAIAVGPVPDTEVLGGLAQAAGGACCFCRIFGSCPRC